VFRVGTATGHGGRQCVLPRRRRCRRPRSHSRQTANHFPAGWVAAVPSAVVASSPMPPSRRLALRVSLDTPWLRGMLAHWWRTACQARRQRAKKDACRSKGTPHFAGSCAAAAECPATAHHRPAYVRRPPTQHVRLVQSAFGRQPRRTGVGGQKCPCPLLPSGVHDGDTSARNPRRSGCIIPERRRGPGTGFRDELHTACPAVLPPGPLGARGPPRLG
jgi:hypothetical protein